MQVNHGQIDVDQAALTGESLPVTMYAGESAKMGSTVVRGEVEGTVEVSRVACGILAAVFCHAVVCSVEQHDNALLSGKGEWHLQCAVG